MADYKEQLFSGVRGCGRLSVRLGGQAQLAGRCRPWLLGDTDPLQGRASAILYPVAFHGRLSALVNKQSADRMAIILLPAVLRCRFTILATPLAPTITDRRCAQLGAIRWGLHCFYR